MKQLSKFNERVITTLTEKVENKQIYYQFETNQENPQPQAVTFSVQAQNGKNLSGNYSKNGGLNLNGQGVSSVEDLQIVNTALSTMLDIVNNNFEISTQAEQQPQNPTEDDTINQ